VSAAELASRLELAAELAEAAQIAALATSVGVGAKPDPDIVNTCTAAIDTLGEAHPGLRARVSAALAQHYAAFGDPARAASMADDALHVARAEDDTESLCLALRVLVRTEGLGSPLEAVTDELVAAARRGGFAAHEAEGLLWQAAARLSLGDANGYVTSLRGLEELAARTRSFSVAANAAAVESSHALLEGRLDDVEYAIDRILEFGAKEPSLVFNAMVTLLRLRFEQGRLEEIADLAAMMDDDTYPIPARSLALAIYHMGRGDLEETRQSYRRFVDQGLDVLEELDHWLFAGLPWLADLVVEMDDAETAARLRESAMPLQGLIVNIAGQYGLASADRCLGQLATTTGDYDEAREHFDAALRLEQPFDTLVARTQYWYARMLAKRREPGDLQHALSLIEASSNTASRLGMATLHAQAQALASAVSMDAASSSL
jgi:tetratricopeptide (TPR) repeat protein